MFWHVHVMYVYVCHTKCSASRVRLRKICKCLRWRHNGRDSVSNHQSHDCLLNRLFRRRSKKTSKLRVTGLCVGNSPGTGEFPAQMASNAENVSIWCRHHVRYHQERQKWHHGYTWVSTNMIVNGYTIIVYFTSENRVSREVHCLSNLVYPFVLIITNEEKSKSDLSCTLKTHLTAPSPRWCIK